jgi:hypothetical protein
MVCAWCSLAIWWDWEGAAVAIRWGHGEYAFSPRHSASFASAVRRRASPDHFRLHGSGTKFRRWALNFLKSESLARAGRRGGRGWPAESCGGSLAREWPGKKSCDVNSAGSFVPRGRLENWGTASTPKPQAPRVRPRHPATGELGHGDYALAPGTPQCKRNCATSTCAARDDVR